MCQYFNKLKQLPLQNVFVKYFLWVRFVVNNYDKMDSEEVKILWHVFSTT